MICCSGWSSLHYFVINWEISSSVVKNNIVKIDRVIDELKDDKLKRCFKLLHVPGDATSKLLCIDPWTLDTLQEYCPHLK